MTINGRAVALASLVALVAANVLVVAKYGPRTGVPTVVLTAAYLGMVAVGAFIARRRFVSARRSRSILFWTIVALSAIGCLFVLDRVPPHSLRVDRWSAMTSFNERLLAGQYPYEARTHLGSRVSGLPMLFALGLPFQWAGDVGYLQVFLLVAFAAVCQRRWGRRYDLVWPFLLLVASPAYAWEVAARSDLASNAMVAVLFLFLCEHWRGHTTSARMAGIGVLGGLVASTRLVMLVPMVVYFVGYFGPHDRRTAAVAAGVALATFTATLAPFVIWDARLFLADNPLAWQIALVPVTVRAAAVAASVVAGLTTDSLGAKCGAAGLIVFAATLASFSISAATSGVGQTPAGTPFDMSYFGLALPFLAVPLLFAYPVPEGGAASVSSAGLLPADGGR
jgi:hypothetical protein